MNILSNNTKCEFEEYIKINDPFAVSFSDGVVPRLLFNGLIVDFFDEKDIHITVRYDNSISMYFGQVITGKTTHTTSDKFTRQEAFRAALIISNTIYNLKNK